MRSPRAKFDCAAFFKAAAGVTFSEGQEGRLLNINCLLFQLFNPGIKFYICFHLVRHGFVPHCYGGAGYSAEVFTQFFSAINRRRN